MLRDIDKLFEGFQDVVKKSKDECGVELEKLRQLPFIINVFFKSFMNSLSGKKEHRVKIGSSLTPMCLIELARISGHTVFFSFNGLYRQAFYNIRYALESIVQGLYIDYNHPKTSLVTKMEILKEIEDKIEYRASRLIGNLPMSDKKKKILREEYRKLSQIVHPTHRQVISTLTDLGKQNDEAPATVDCNEVSRIYDSMARTYDVFFFLFITHFPEIKEELGRNSDFIIQVKTHHLTLLSKTLGVEL